MSKITLLNEKAIAAEVEREEDSFVSYYWIGTDNKLYANFGQIDYPLEVVLPPGSWSILGRPDEITEEQWKGIVKKVMPFGKVERFKDYEYPDSAFYEAKNSGLSLLKSKSLEGKSIIILIKQ